MEYNYAKKQVHRIKRNSIIIWLCIFIAIGVWLNFFAASIKNLYMEPAKVDSSIEELEELHKKRDYYVEFEVDELISTGYTYQESGKDKKYYFGFITDDGVVFCKTSTNMKEEVYKNYKVKGKISKADNVDREVREEFTTEIGIRLDETSLYIIDMTSSKTLDIVITSVLYIAWTMSLLAIIFMVATYGSYQSNKWYKRMGTINNMQSEAVNNYISSECNQIILKKSKMTITTNWILMKTIFSFKAQKLENAIWAYKQITQHRTNGIPTGKSYSVRMWFKDGTSVDVSSRSDKKALEFISELEQLLPNAVFGHSDELDQLYKTDRDTFMTLPETFREQKRTEDNDN